MPIITALQSRARSRMVAVYVDGERALEADRSVVGQGFGLAVGMPVDYDLLERVRHADRVRAAVASAIRRLAHRAHSARELRTGLARSGFTAAQIDGALEKLAQSGAIDDDAFAVQFIEARARTRPQSARRTRLELAQRGLSKEQVQAAFAQADGPGELALAKAALETRARDLPRDAEQRRAAFRRLAGFLARRGFDWDIARKALAAFFSPGDGPDALED